MDRLLGVLTGLGEVWASRIWPTLRKVPPFTPMVLITFLFVVDDHPDQAFRMLYPFLAMSMILDYNSGKSKDKDK